LGWHAAVVIGAASVTMTACSVARMCHIGE